MKAWHFLRKSGKLRYGIEPPPDGEWLVHHGHVAICESGLHASKKIIDALRYAHGPIICRVECDCIVMEDPEKFVCRKRKILWRYDATNVLIHFARLRALDVVHLWDAPEIMVRYLKTGDESIRDAARATVGYVGWDEKRVKEWAAERAAEWASDESWAASISAAAAAERASNGSWAAAMKKENQNKHLTTMINQSRSGANSSEK